MGKKDIETIAKLIRPVDSKLFRETAWEELNIDKEGGLVILPEKFRTVKAILKSNEKVIYYEIFAMLILT